MKILKNFLLFSFLIMSLHNVYATEMSRLAFTVVCDDTVLAEKIRTGVRTRLGKAQVEVVEQLPQAKLFLYVMRDVNDRVNKNGISIAIAYVSNAQTAQFALDKINKKEDMSEILLVMLREEGYLKHLSVAHLDADSEVELGIFMDTVVDNFVHKYSNNGN